VGRRPGGAGGNVSGDGCTGGNVGQIRGNSGGSDDIVQRQFRYVGGELHQHAQGLADASGGSQYGDFLSHGCGGGIKSAVVRQGSVDGTARCVRSKHDTEWIRGWFSFSFLFWFWFWFEYWIVVRGWKNKTINSEVLRCLVRGYICRLRSQLLPSLFETYRSENGIYRLGSGHRNDGMTEEKKNDASRLLDWSMFAKLKKILVAVN